LTNLPGYLYNAVRNKTFDLFARKEFTGKHLHVFGQYYQNASGTPADHLARERNFHAYIKKEVDSLPPRMKAVFELSENQNLSRNEVAMKLGITKNNVRGI
jgi:DNA-directed RNA polymerase specialized sigma24 family protein